MRTRFFLLTWFCIHSNRNILSRRASKIPQLIQTCSYTQYAKKNGISVVEWGQQGYSPLKLHSTLPFEQNQRLWQGGGFPGASGGKESAYNAGDPGSSPGLRRSPGEGESGNTGIPTPVFLTGESHGQRRLVGYSPWEHKESDMTERLIFHFGKEEPGRTVRWEKKYLPQKFSAQTTWGLKISVLGENVTFCKDKGGTQIL